MNGLFSVILLYSKYGIVLLFVINYDYEINIVVINVFIVIFYMISIHKIIMGSNFHRILIN